MSRRIQALWLAAGLCLCATSAYSDAPIHSPANTVVAVVILGKAYSTVTNLLPLPGSSWSGDDESETRNGHLILTAHYSYRMKQEQNGHLFVRLDCYVKQADAKEFEHVTRTIPVWEGAPVARIDETKVPLGAPSQDIGHDRKAYAYRVLPNNS
jgi:hypothetical protein